MGRADVCAAVDVDRRRRMDRGQRADIGRLTCPLQTGPAGV
ncbi:hypothetical protein BMA10247_A1952 [Burkholderia mallei NCTC 10247]|nr:hypothetical protein BMA10247_A1952 [Burkholderia mallei NCTC 10247]